MYEEQIKPYDARRDAAVLALLWQQCLGTTWPLSEARIQHILAQGPVPHHFVLWENGQLIGFAATFHDPHDEPPSGSLAALLVAPHRQRQGIGSLLHDAAIGYLRAQGIQTLHLGRGLSRFWCGIPTNLPQATTFFHKHGWSSTHTVYDLVQDIRHYQLDPRITQRLSQEQITIAPTTSQNVTDALAFEAREFPDWFQAPYKPYAALGDFQDILAARDQHGAVVGTLVMHTPHSHPTRTGLIWQALLGEDHGGISAVGVAQNARGRGIGLALVALGTTILRERGVHTSYIDWVELTDFYAKVGYQQWRSYAICSPRSPNSICS